MADDFLEELLQPVRDADEEDMQEADFWNGVGEEEDFLDEDSAAIAETAGEPVQEAVAAMSKSKPTKGLHGFVLRSLRLRCVQDCR